MTINLTTPYKTEKGSSHPLGAIPDRDGVNFSIFSEHATSVELLLFSQHDALEPVQIIQLDTKLNKTFHFWHVYVRGLKPGSFYAYRIDGPRTISTGDRFDPQKVLIDPYARGNVKTLWNRANACVPGDNVATSLRSVVIDTADYDWEGDRPLNHAMSETIIYEVHVRGFTQSPTSGVERPGTFAGLIEKIPYLQSLGITAVELLPVYDFDDTDFLSVDGKPLKNYWGYSPMCFFAPHSHCCTEPEAGCHVREFRDMVKALHRADIEVILDVVFNHTDEGNHEGPIFSLKAIDNRIYYYLMPGNEQYYADYTGCGNTLNCNHPVTQKMIVECLRYWVTEMHVDGFRFDEASVLSRGEDGSPMKYPPVLWQVELDEILADTKVIAEAWDAAGLYQVGYFPGYRWAEWNGCYRDDVRRFVRGEAGLVGPVASRIAGSADLYQWRGHFPINSINFITCHDGFTLNDLVSYNQKNNQANGEGNRDGSDENLSWNHGIEGETAAPEVETLRERQIKNFATILFLSQGVPMLLAGDEVRRTQKGNNNAYCQDNEISWFDWTLVERNDQLLRFWQLLIQFRKCHPTLQYSDYFTGNEVNERGLADISWHGCQLYHPGWEDPQARALAFTLGGFNGAADLHVMINMYSEALDFEIPLIHGRQWYVVVDTARASPLDIVKPGQEKLVMDQIYSVMGRSINIFISK